MVNLVIMIIRIRILDIVVIKINLIDIEVFKVHSLISIIKMELDLKRNLYPIPNDKVI